MQFKRVKILSFLRDFRARPTVDCSKDLILVFTSLVSQVIEHHCVESLDTIEISTLDFAAFKTINNRASSPC